MKEEIRNCELFGFLENQNSSRLVKIYEEGAVNRGRILQGLIYLELLSEAHQKGNDKLFDHLNETTPFNLKLEMENINNKQDKVNFILKCMNFERIDEKLKRTCSLNTCNDRYKLFQQVMVNIYDDVVSGTFERKNYKKLIPYIRQLILMIKHGELQ